MFLKTLRIENNNSLIREIIFHKGINLIIDETKAIDKANSDNTESGNNVGKTTILRLIDYCFGSDGKNIYKDPEFNNKNNSVIENFLKNNNIIVSLILKEDLEDASSKEILIRRNFLARTEKLQEINGENYNGEPSKEFCPKLKELIFNSKQSKPTIRQIVSKNIRDEKNKLTNTIRTLHPIASNAEYEALYLFWLGIELDSIEKKQNLYSDQRVEEKLQTRLKQESNSSEIEQYLIIIERNIKDLTARKNSFNLNESFKDDLDCLNRAKSEINKLSTELGSLEFRKDLITQSEDDLKKEFSKIDNQQIKSLYKEAKSLIPNLQRSFEDTVNFHNQMISEKIKYITQELPELDAKIITIKRKLGEFLATEKQLTEKLRKIGIEEDFQQSIIELNKAYEQKGHLEEQKSLWQISNGKLKDIRDEISKIDKIINSKDGFIKERITEFNKYFSQISSKLYGEQFALIIPDEVDGKISYHNLSISSGIGNPGTGKKKGQIAAFDLAYIQFADAMKINCLHFILHDQIETVHDNQISNLLTEIVGGINCQYVLTVLRDKLPKDIDIDQYKILSLSQSKKLFKI